MYLPVVASPTAAVAVRKLRYISATPAATTAGVYLRFDERTLVDQIVPWLGQAIALGQEGELTRETQSYLAWGVAASLEKLRNV